MAEAWRPIGDGKRYQVSNMGRVKSMERCCHSPSTKNGFRRVSERILKTPLSDGYPTVTLSGLGWPDAGQKRPDQRVQTVHRLVASAFIGLCPAGQQVRHLDGNPLNNALDNLAYGSPAQNVRDAQQHGTFNQHRIPDDVVKAIRRDAASGLSQRIVANRHGVSQPTVSDIINGRGRFK